MHAEERQCDVIVIGAGIAGAGVAAALSVDQRVVLLEREAQPGYHSTGRSAAVFAESYGGAAVRALTRASRAFFERPPTDFAASSLLTPRGFLFLARDDQQASLEALASMPDMQRTAQRLTPAQARERMPLLREGYLGSALFDVAASDIDVHALHQGFLTQLRHRGGQLHCGVEAEHVERVRSGWRVSGNGMQFTAPVVVNAAGAWADVIAQRAGVAGVGLQPLRRSAALIDASGFDDIGHWPLTIDIDEEFYFKPDAGRLLISPGDETPSEACDAQPDDLDLAMAVDRIEQATTLDVRRMHSRWAGLRSFVADRTPVAGFAADAPGFFWLAGQGGYGIQTAPALSLLAAALVRQHTVPAELLDHGIDISDLRSDRAGLRS